jgi:nitrogen regulatory protein P-II 1
MREIKVYLRSAALEPVMRALHDAGVAHIVVNHVQSYGSGVDPKHLRLSMEAGTQYTENAKMEFVCADPEVDAFVQLIQRQAHTGAPGDGIIFVSPVERAFKIRTRTEGREALR